MSFVAVDLNNVGTPSFVNWTTTILKDFLQNSLAWSLNAIMGPSIGRGRGGGGLSLWTLLDVLTSPGDLIKLLIIGGLLETLRRLLGRAWNTFLGYFYLTATLEVSEPSYQWILVWLAQCQSWSSSRSVLITQPPQGYLLRGTGPQRLGVDRRDEDWPIEFQSMFGTKCSLWYKRSYIQIFRHRGSQEKSPAPPTKDALHFTIFLGGHQKLKDLLAEARALYKSRVANRIRIHSCDSSHRSWFTSMVRAKRGLESVVLDEGVKTMLIEDAKEFLRSEQWYADRGIPWRRGYLLHGCPGSGKTSLIHAIAGELDLDIYVISLSQRDMDDTALNRLITTLPPRSIALMEDIDVAFTRAPSREHQQASHPSLQSNFIDTHRHRRTPLREPFQNLILRERRGSSNGGNSSGGVTLAGLLGTIDGMAAQEGRILFATTNQYHALDSALKRPGRLDIHVEFKNASRKQAEELFKRFYPAVVQIPGVDVTSEKPLIDLSNAELVSTNGSPITNIIETEKPTPIGGIGSSPNSEGSAASPHLREAPRLSESELSVLAKRFASLLPEREFSMAAIQGHLMRYKVQPHRAIEETEGFVAKERDLRELEVQGVTRELLSAGSTSTSTSGSVLNSPPPDRPISALEI